MLTRTLITYQYSTGETDSLVPFSIIPKPFFKSLDKLIGKGCPTTGVLSMWNEIQRIASLHLAETLRPTALPHDSALHL